jgi:hypothetical protein
MVRAAAGYADGGGDGGLAGRAAGRGQRGRAWVPAAGQRLGPRICDGGSPALVCRAFTELAVTRIVATTMAVNTRSRRVLEKAGLGYLRTVHLDWPDPLPGNEHGDVEYQLHRDDWPRP